MGFPDTEPTIDARLERLAFLRWLKSSMSWFPRSTRPKHATWS